MRAIEENKLTPDTRSEIVCGLVTYMYGFMEKPSASFCKFVAQCLILQHKRFKGNRICEYDITHIAWVFDIGVLNVLPHSCLKYSFLKLHYDCRILSMPNVALIFRLSLLCS